MFPFFLILALAGAIAVIWLLWIELKQAKVTIKTLKKRRVKASPLLISALEDCMINALNEQNIEKYIKYRNFYIDLVPIDE